MPYPPACYTLKSIPVILGKAAGQTLTASACTSNRFGPIPLKPATIEKNPTEPANPVLSIEKAFKNEFGRIFSQVSFVSDLSTLLIEWHGYTTNQQIGQVTSWIEEQAPLHSCTTLLHDCTKLMSVWEDTIQWFSRSWMPKMNRNGITTFIHVAKQGTFGDRIGKQIGDILIYQVRFHAFDNTAAAWEWLRKNNSFSAS